MTVGAGAVPPGERGSHGPGLHTRPSLVGVWTFQYGGNDVTVSWRRLQMARYLMHSIK